MSTGDVLASGALALYHHVKGEWTPVKGDASSKSNATLTKAKNGSCSVKVVFNSSSEVLLNCVLTPNSTIQLQAGYETFYLLYDGKAYWGLWFSDSTVAKIFCDKTSVAIKSLSGSKSSAPAAPSTSSTSVAAAAAKMNKSTSSAAVPSSSSLSPTTTAKRTFGETKSPSDNKSPSRINATVSEAHLSKPITPQPKLNSTISEAGLRAGLKSTVAAPRPSASSTPPGTSSSYASSNGNSTANGSSVPALKRPLSSLPTSPSTTPPHSAHTNGDADDSSKLQHSPSTKALKRPDAVARKRSGTTLAMSGDQHPTSDKISKKDKSQREKVIDELIKTEEDYVDSLALIREKYLFPLKYAPRLGVSIFKPGDLEKIMYGIEPIFGLNSELLGALKYRKHDKSLYDCCGATLDRYAPSMKLYIDYVNKYDNTIKKIKEYEDASPTFRQFLSATSEDPDSNSRSIYDYWIMPVQRIPRYCLLLNEIMKYTSTDHSDYSFIKQALLQIQKIAEYINDGKKKYDSQEKVAMIQQRLNPKSLPVIRERRIWVNEGIVYMRNALFIPPKKPITVKKGKPEPLPEALGLMEVEFFLLNDLILWAVKDLKHGYLNDIGRIPIQDLITCDERPALSVPFYDNTAMYRAFTLRIQDQDEESAPIFYCSDHTSCEKWIQQIKETFQKTAMERASELERRANGRLSTQV